MRLFLLRFGDGIRRTAMSALAAVSLIMAVFPSVVAHAQLAVVQQQQREQDRRLDSLEHLEIQKRVTALETETSEMAWEMRTILAGTGGLLVEALLRFKRK